MLKVKILGNSGLYPTRTTPTSGYLFFNQKTAIVADMGSGVFANLMSVMPPEKVAAVVLTHLHNDHIADVGVYDYYLESLAKKGLFDGKIKLYVKCANNSDNLLIGRLNYFEAVEIQTEKTFTAGDFNINFYRMKHPIETYGLSVCDGERKVGYSGDTNFCPALTELVSGCDLTVCDGAFCHTDWNENKPHADAYGLSRLSAETGKKIVVTHIPPTCDLKTMREEIGNNPRCVLAELMADY